MNNSSFSPVLGSSQIVECPMEFELKRQLIGHTLVRVKETEWILGLSC